MATVALMSDDESHTYDALLGFAQYVNSNTKDQEGLYNGVVGLGDNFIAAIEATLDEFDN
jgi:hypothetical protein